MAYPPGLNRSSRGSAIWSLTLWQAAAGWHFYSKSPWVSLSISPDRVISACVESMVSLIVWFFRKFYMQIFYIPIKTSFYLD